MKQGQPLGEHAVRGKNLLLRSPKIGDALAFRDFNDKLVEEKEKNPELAIVDPDSRISDGQAREWVARMVKSMESEDLVSVFAYDGHALVGTCNIHRPRARELRHTGLLDIALLDDYRGLGLGSRMVTESLGLAMSMGVWLIELRVFSNNYAAIRLYQKAGFTESGVVPNFVRKNGRYLDDVQMYIDLRDSDKSSTRARPKS